MPSYDLSNEKNRVKETMVAVESRHEFEMFTKKILYVVTAMRLNFIDPAHWNCRKIINAIITTIMLGLACYSLIYTMHNTFSMTHSAMMMSSKLLTIAWSIQSIVSVCFLIYWQVNGHMKSFHRQIMECQDGVGIREGRKMIIKNIIWFYSVIFIEIFIISLYNIAYYVGNNHSDFVIRQAKMFYFSQLRFLNSVITLYTYIAWNACMFLYIIYTNAAFLEIKHFNDELEKLDGAADDVEFQLLNKMETYGRLCGIVRELDRIFRVFTIAQVLSSHMEQYDLGISIWGFAILSRPLVLATFSVMAMVLSVIIELTPTSHMIEIINCTTSTAL
ncbi:hypothetical protein RB195_020652 [Necator americanus]|uniref:Gustatory receptor n=1 Tax=Necator americanus TaxID=51031 RepID=A0ABR1CM18_NECAM